MPQCKLFAEWTFKLDLPEPFNDPSVQKARTDVYSRYCSTRAKRSTLHAPTLRALLKYAALVDAAENNTWDPSFGAIGNQGTAFLVAEYPGNETECAVYNRNTAKFLAGVKDPAQTGLTPYSVSNSAHTGTALLFCLMPVIADNEEFSDTFPEFLEAYRNGFTDLDAVSATASVLCDNIYRRIENASSLGQNGINVSIPSTGNINTLSNLAMDNGQYTPDSSLYGTFQVFQAGSSPAAAVVIPHADLVGRYPLSNRMLTAEEAVMVPVLPSWYVIPEEVQCICQHLYQTTATANPMRNIMLRGPAGTGKTEAAKAIAAGLGLPYLFLTCSANSEIYDLLGQILPVTESSDIGKLREKYSLPSAEDIMMDPPSAYAQMTGEYLDDITEDQVLSKMLELMGSKSSGAGEEKKAQFEFVETPLVKALRNGWTIEIQEPTVIANPGVLVGLNSLLDRCAAVTLPNGQVIQRHPDTVIIMTTNTEYEGCRGLNQSLSSRMNLIIDMDEPDLQTTVRRVMGITGSTDQAMVAKMAEVVQGINQRCRETMITDGTCGIRELIAWVQSAMITKDAYSSALYTVISSATAGRENREDLISILESQFTR